MTEGPVGVGSRYTGHWKIGSVPVGGVIEVVEFDEARDLAWIGDHRRNAARSVPAARLPRRPDQGDLPDGLRSARRPARPDRRLGFRTSGRSDHDGDAGEPAQPGRGLAGWRGGRRRRGAPTSSRGRSAPVPAVACFRRPRRELRPNSCCPVRPSPGRPPWCSPGSSASCRCRASSGWSPCTAPAAGRCRPNHRK